MSSAAIFPDMNKGPAINAVIWSGFAISTIFVIIRLFARLKITKSAGWDDACLVVAVAINVVSTSLSSITVASGLGRHTMYLHPDQIAKTIYYTIILEPFGIMATFVPKVAVLILIMSLMGPRKSGKWFLYTIVSILGAICLLCSCFLYAQCFPTSKLWRPETPGRCLSPHIQEGIAIAQGSWSAFVDLALALFPMTIFWNLQVPIGRKIQISVLMGMGVLAAASAVVRTVFLSRLQSADFTWANSILVIWASIEVNVLIICACMPVLPRLFTALAGKDGSQNRSLRTFVKGLSPSTLSSADTIAGPYGSRLSREKYSTEISSNRGCEKEFEQDDVIVKTVEYGHRHEYV